MAIKVTTESLIARLIEIYGEGTYSYSDLVYKDNITNVAVHCNKHNVTFYTTPHALKKGHGCKECSPEKRSIARTTTDLAQFMASAERVHGDKYDYSDTIYKNVNTKVLIRCRKHGPFLQLPTNHIGNGNGCKQCNNEMLSANKTLTNDQFLERAKAKHGDLYDYTLAFYIKHNVKVKILCKQCGNVFKQSPHAHMDGRGCATCCNKKRADAISNTTEYFVNKAKEVHGDRYDYSDVDYTRSFTPVTILCTIHGPFTQTPSVHLSGSGCRQCANDSIGLSNSDNNESYIAKAVKIYGDRFDYSKLDYKGTFDSITVICKEHNVTFTQLPNAHLNHIGCKECNSIMFTELRLSNTEEFIKKSKEAHGDKYDYGKTIYTHSKEEVEIYCNKHKKYFNQIPNAHLKGSGCQLCNNSRGEERVSLHLDKLSIEYTREYIIPNSNTAYRYDFYLPKLNILIEYDGELHYSAVEFFGGVDALKKTQERDKRKDALAKLNNIPLIRIHYEEYKNIEDYLLFRLSKIYKYNTSNGYYKNFLDLCKGELLALTTKVKDVKKYLTYKNT